MNNPYKRLTVKRLGRGYLVKCNYLSPHEIQHRTGAEEAYSNAHDLFDALRRELLDAACWEIAVYHPTHPLGKEK